MTQPEDAPGGNAVAVVEPKPIAQIRKALDERLLDIADVLPRGMDASRFVKVALLAVSKNPDLLACTPASVVRSIVEAAELGLEPTGSLSRAWLVPFKDRDKPRPEAQLIIGYQGLADLMRDTQLVRQVWAEVVYEGDEFSYELGMHPTLRHVPAHLTEDPTKITFAYACARFADGAVQFHVMSKAQIDAIRARAKAKNGPAWTYSYAQMARKSALRQLANYVPLSTKAQTAIERDDEREIAMPASAPAPEGPAPLRDALAVQAARITGTTMPAETAVQPPDIADQASDIDQEAVAQ